MSRTKRAPKEEAGGGRLEAGRDKAEVRGRMTEDGGGGALRRASDPARPRVTGHEPRVTDRATSDERRATPRCSNCVYARRPTGRWLRLILSRWMGLLLCTNHPDAQGDILGVPACSRCPNFRARDERRTKAEVQNPIGPLVCQIPLTKRKVALVDAADYRWLSGYHWFLSGTRHGSCYAATHIRGRVVTMHRLIMDLPKGMWVHHLDDNGLNNCRDNLCICTPQQNARRHRRRKNATSEFIGVFRRRGVPDKWYAKVESGNERAYLGPFDNAIEAAVARDRKAIQMHAEFARLNFPEERDQRLREIEAARRAEDGELRTDGGA